MLVYSFSAILLGMVISPIDVFVVGVIVLGDLLYCEKEHPLVLAKLFKEVVRLNDDLLARSSGF